MAERIVKSYKVLVGMEIHVQLATATKMFTRVANGASNFGAESNSLVDEVVLGLPGVLPVMNKRAVEHSIKVGLALGCQIARHTKWDRKSYYYPDLPKNYQISQYDLPLCYEGSFELALDDGSTKTVRIRRAHLEEDAGKLLHEAPGGFPIDYSIVDLNRAGTPLLEIVTEPDLSSGREVALFGQELQKIVQYLGVSEAQMQMGHMRFEPNINVHITDQTGQVHKTAITEIKNLNSFSVLERATTYEVQRQIHAWIETGSLGRKCTMGWDESTGQTFLQREKEEAHDYRYFPDPDLVPVEVSEEWIAHLKSEIGELPAARRRRYIEAMGLSEKDAALLASDRAGGDYFDAIVSAGVDPKRAGTMMETLREMSNERGQTLAQIGIAPARVAEVAQLASTNKIAASKETAKAILARLIDHDAPAEQAAAELNLLQTSDTGAIDAAIEQLLAQNPRPLQDYKSGKQAAMGALVGMIMKSAKGLNPKVVQERLRERLESGQAAESTPVSVPSVISEKAFDDLVGRIVTLASRTHTPGFGKIRHREKFMVRRGVGFSFVDADIDLYDDTLRLLLDIKDWGSKFSEKHIDNLLASLIWDLGKEQNPESARGALKAALRELAQFDQQTSVFLPLSGIEMQIPSFPAGRIVLRQMSEDAVRALGESAAVITRQTLHPPHEQEQLVKSQEKRFQEWIGTACAEFRVVAEPERAREQAIVEARRVLDLFRFAIPAIYPASHHVSVGLMGDVLRSSRQMAAVSAKNFSWTESVVGPLSNFTIDAATIKRFDELGVTQMFRVLAKPESALTDYEQALLKAIHWFATAQTQDEQENRLLNLVTSLEALLAPRDSNPIGTAIAEGVALLLGSGLDERRRLKKTIQELYRLRSGISHGGHKVVLDAELRKLTVIAGSLLVVAIRHRDRFTSQRELLDWLESQKLG